MSGQRQDTAALPPGKKLDTNFIGGYNIYIYIPTTVTKKVIAIFYMPLTRAIYTGERWQH
jgi:hypothetical protein